MTTVLSLFGTLGGYSLGAARVIVGVIAIILIFRGPANDYSRAVKASKRLRTRR